MNSEIINIIGRIREELQKPLPGIAAQQKMFPITRLKKTYQMPEYVKNGAVLLLLYPKDKHLTICFIKRANDGGVHSGQISFPGGKAEDSDKDLIFTALRETEEEIGVHISKIEILGPLSNLYIPVSNYSVSPVVGFCSLTPEFRINQSEVAELLEVKLSHFSDKKNCLFGAIHVDHQAFEVPYYQVNNYKIWGATAMILSEFIQIIENAGIGDYLKMIDRIEDHKTNQEI